MRWRIGVAIAVVAGLAMWLLVEPDDHAHRSKTRASALRTDTVAAAPEPSAGFAPPVQPVPPVQFAPRPADLGTGSRRIVFEVTVDGTPRIPNDFNVLKPRIRRMRLPGLPGRLTGWIAAADSEAALFISAPAWNVESPATVPPRGPVHVRLTSPTEVRVEVIAADAEMADLVSVQPLSTDGRLVRGNFRVRIPLEREGDRHVNTHPLHAGHYCVMLRDTGLFLTEFDVQAGCKQQTVTIDLRAAEWLTIRIVPASELRASASGQFVVRGPRQMPFSRISRYALAPPGMVRSASLTDQLRILHPCDRELELSFTGTTLHPHAETGTVRTRRGGTSQLVGIAPPTVRFGWPRTRQRFPTKIHLVPHGGGETIERSLIHGGEALAFAGLPNSIFDLVIHDERFAPFAVHGVRQGAEPIDLGKFEPTRGAELTVIPRGLARESTLKVQVHWLDFGVDVVKSSTTGSRGVFTLYRIPTGRLRLSFRIDTATWTQEVDCRGPQTTKIRVECGNR